MNQYYRDKTIKFAEWILKRTLETDDRDHVLGDFDEFYLEIRQESGVVRALVWYWLQVLKSIPHFIRNFFYWRTIMIKANTVTALRNIRKHKGYSFINVVGLAVGMACCMVIFLYISNELSYDAHHQDADRIYRVMEYRKVPVGEFRTASVAGPVATVLKDHFPQVEVVARILPIHNGMVTYNGRHFYEDRMFYADPELFQLFSIPFLYGNPATALERPGTVTITERMARKYFGDENPLGKIIEINDPMQSRLPNLKVIRDFEITGVISDPPSNTHFKYDFIASLSMFKNSFLLREWHAGPTYTYAKLLPETNLIEFEEKIKNMAYDFVSQDLNAWGQTRHYFSQPLRDIHFQSQIGGLPIRNAMETHGNKLYITIYSLIGFLVLLIGCMNFINLSNSRSIYRAKEVGLRKVIGAQRFQLARQFLGESIVITFFAALCAIVIVRLLLPSFNEMASTQLTISELLKPVVLAGIAGLIFFVGLVAGGYPAFVLTTVKPALTVKGVISSKMHGSFMLKVLVIGQFAISIFLAIGTVTVYQQLQFMRGGSLGFDKEQKVVIPFRSNRNLRNNYRMLKSEFLQHPNILGATASSTVPGRPIRNNYLKYSDDKLDKPWELKFIACDHNFIPEYKIELIAGRSFRDERGDENNAFIINEAAVPLLGFQTPEEALGAKLHEGWYGRWKRIIGVIKNFHYMGMQQLVQPLFMEYSTSRFNALTLSVSTGHYHETMAFIEKKWRELHPTIPFEGFFLDEDFNRQYRKEEQVGQMLGTIASMGLVIACLGLLGLAAFMAQQRTREIGIRKVLGASVPQIVTLLSKNLFLFVLVASLLAGAAAYYTLNQWLQDFTYRIQMNWMSFVLPSAVALLIAFMTVGFQAIRAAQTDPVEALKYE